MPHELWVTTENGRLFVKRWEPAVPQSRAQAPIVLFHDSLGCVELWRDFPAQLAAATERSVIAYDRLGFGQSDPYPGTLPLSFVSDEAGGSFAALREQLELEQFVAFGHSVGGGMAIECAVSYSLQCQALVTESAQVFVEEQTLEGIRKAKQAFAQPGQLDRLKKYHGDKAAWVLSAWVDSWLAESFRDWTLEESLPLVRCPVLAIHGEQDEYGSLRQPERIAALTRSPATTAILADCGHVPHREMADAVLDAVEAFLDDQTTLGLDV